MKKQTRRVQLELPDKSMHRLEKLKEITEAGSYAEVFRSAMMAYEWLIDRHEQGESILIKDSAGEIREVELFNP